MDAYFRCMRSGNIMKIDDPDFIAELRGHESYMEVTSDSTKGNYHAVPKHEENAVPQDAVQAVPDQGSEAEEVSVSPAVHSAGKKRGRPAKRA